MAAVNELAKAELRQLDSKRSTRRQRANQEPEPLVVQFNPTSLRLQHASNDVRGGTTELGQRAQYPSSRHVTLSFDLEFDTAEEQQFTADEGTATGRPVSVRTLTAKVRQFVQPPTDDSGNAPPRVRFQWGSFIFVGIVTQVSEDLDYFALDGTPLRAKLGVTISEQNLDHERNAAGPGARDDRGATEPGGDPARPTGSAGGGPLPGAAPGRSGTGDVEDLVAALEGESAQQLAARIGGNPAAWRSLMNGLASPLALAAGTPVEVGPELDVAETVGRAAGFAAGVDLSAAEGLAGALGLSAAVGGAPTPSGPVVAGPATTAAEAAGLALAAAGGIAKASTQVLADASARRTAAERASFAVPAAPTTQAGEGEGELDPRALSYGRSLPLRARVHLPTLDAIKAGGRRSLAARARPAELPIGDQAGAAPWERLPPAAAGRSAADQAQRGRDARPSTIRWRPGGGCR
jgi:hypothetical protein